MLYCYLFDNNNYYLSDKSERLSIGGVSGRCGHRPIFKIYRK